METTTEKSTQLTILLDKSGLQKETILMLKEKFQPFFDQSEEWLTKAKALVITDVSQVKEMKQAREARIALKDIRVPADKTRAMLKKDALLYNSVVQDIYNTWVAPVEEAEAHLLEQENFKKVQEEKQKVALKAEREEKLAPYLADVSIYPLGDISEDAFQQLFNGSKLAFEKKIEDDKKAAEQELENEKQATLHHERKESILTLWNYLTPDLQESHLGEIEQDKWDNIVKDLNKRKKDADAKIARDKAESAKKAKELQAQLDKAKADKEKADADANKTKAIADKKLAEEKKKAADLKASLDKIEADRKAQLDRDALDLKAKQLAEKKAQSAPDKEKLLQFASSLETLEQYSGESFHYPEVKSAEAKIILADAQKLLVKLATFIREKTAQL